MIDAGSPLPIFPLPNVVLFPNVFLPLHIFEPRYREMVADALASDRMLGMGLLLGRAWPGGGVAAAEAVLVEAGNIKLFIVEN